MVAAASQHGWLRDAFTECGDNADESCIVCSCIGLLGPTLVILGLLLLTDAIGNPPGKKAGVYNAGVRAWESTGYPTFAAAWCVPLSWPGAVHCQELTPCRCVRSLCRPATEFTVNVTSGGTDKTIPPQLEVAMSVEQTVVPLAVSNGEQTYTDALWYSGELDLWGGGWPTTDNYFTLTVEPVGPVVLEAFTCSNVGTTDDGGACALPATATRRSLASRLPTCTRFYRQVQFQETLLLIANPPTLKHPNWTLAAKATGCGMEYEDVLIPVTPAEFSADLATMPWPGAPPAWCNTWGALTLQRPNSTQLSIRSADDPYVLSGTLTGCTQRFGLSRRTYARLGTKYLILPGVMAAAVSGFVLMCLVARRRAMLRARAEAGFDEGMPLAGPPSFVPSALGGNIPTSYGATTAAGKGFQRQKTGD